MPQTPQSVAYRWGTTAAEREASYSADEHLRDADEALYRAVDVGAPADLVYRWLCQLRVAPYSYDWIDNFGRQSPRRLTPGMEHLARGQRFMRIFTLVAFETNRHVTLAMHADEARAVFGDVVVTYQVTTQSEGMSRLVAKLLVRYPRGIFGQVMRWLLPWGDLVMMRCQLLNLKELAEQQHRVLVRPDAS